MFVTLSYGAPVTQNFEEKKQVMLGAIPLIIPDAHLPVMKRAAFNKGNNNALNKGNNSLNKEKDNNATLNKEKDKKEDLSNAA